MKRNIWTFPNDYSRTQRSSKDICREFSLFRKFAPAPMPWQDRALIVVGLLAVVAVILWGQP